MKKGKYSGKHSSKTLVLVLALVLLLGCVTGGTLAWLTAQSAPVENTFAPSNISITLGEETTGPYQMIPGWTITKDPKTTVVAGSEDCFLFVKVEESSNFDDFMTYEIADGWITLTGADGVYYREVTSDQMGTAYSVLKNDQVIVIDTVTKQMMDDLTDATQPTLTFTAYASQMYKNNTDKFDPLDAWNNISGSANA